MSGLYAIERQNILHNKLAQIATWYTGFVHIMPAFLLHERDLTSQVDCSGGYYFEAPCITNNKAKG